MVQVGQGEKTLVKTLQRKRPFPMTALPIQKRIKGTMWSNNIWHFGLSRAPCSIGHREPVETMDVSKIISLDILFEPYSHKG